MIIIIIIFLLAFFTDYAQFWFSRGNVFILVRFCACTFL